MNKDSWEAYDITDYHRLKYLGNSVEEVLVVLLKQLKVGVGVFEVGEHIRALYLNEAYFECVGYTKEEYSPYLSDIYSTLFSEDVDGFQQCIMEHAPKKEKIQYEFRGYRQDGSCGWFEVKGEFIENQVSETPIYLTVITDITDKKEKDSRIQELKQVNNRLLLEEERFKILEETVYGLLFEYNPEEDVMVFSYNFPNNKKRKVVTNYTEYMKTSPMVHSSHVEMFKEALMTACHTVTEADLEYLSTVSGGGYRWQRTHYKSVVGTDGTIVSVIGRIEDIHDEKMKQEMLNYKASMDGLTNLYRKEIAFEKMQEYVDDDSEGEFYFVILDLDDFKQINDQHGHQYGDQVLQKMAKILVREFGETSIIGRFGGDEFIILTKGISKEEVVVRLEQAKIQIAFCAGIVKWKCREDMKETFNRADKAMYEIKMAEKNGIHFIE